ncbi:MAG: acetylglutamate kinase, partial [Deltaproteobacteria bacterium]
NLIPVLFGDVVIDVGKKIDILSGDAIMSYLASMLDVEKAIFLMDVDGIYDRSPNDEKARLIDELNEEAKISAIEGKFDVTGGIKNKIREAMKMDCIVYFINGLDEGNLTKAIEGKKVGTIKKGK